MKTYKTIKHAQAIQFTVEGYHRYKNEFPTVLDKASISVSWTNRTANDGRYALITGIISGHFQLQSLKDGDYIVEENDALFVLSREVFERNYEMTEGRQV